MKNFLLLFLLIGTTLVGYAQHDKRFDMGKDVVIVNFTESTAYAHILPEKSKFRAKDNSYYAWFGANDIKRTRGGYDGKLLHGVYKEFYPNKNLKDLGKYKKGIKTGKWKSWYTSGQFKEIAYFQNGQKRSYTLYASDGAIYEKGTFKNELLHGKIYHFENRKLKTVVSYKKGIVGKKKDLTIEKIKMPKPKKGKQYKDSLTNQILPNGILAPPDQLPKKGKIKKQRKKEKEPDVKVRKFLWIIPMQEKPRPEKQT